MSGWKDRQQSWLVRLREFHWRKPRLEGLLKSSRNYTKNQSKIFSDTKKKTTRLGETLRKSKRKQEKQKMLQNVLSPNNEIYGLIFTLFIHLKHKQFIQFTEIQVNPFDLCSEEKYYQLLYLLRGGNRMDRDIRSISLLSQSLHICLTFDQQYTKEQFGLYSFRAVNPAIDKIPKRIAFEAVSLIILLIDICYYYNKQMLLQFKQLLQNYRMAQRYSQNSQLMHNPQEYQLDESVILNPIKLPSPAFKNNKTKHDKLFKPTSLGEFEGFKLTEFFNRKNIAQEIDSAMNTKSARRDLQNVIQVITVDEQSLVCYLNQEFVELMSKYTGCDVSFVSVAGQQKSGKSFLLDKILNLSQVKGNHFCNKKRPGIYMYPVPFIKEGLNIFLLQISGVKLNSESFKILNVFCMGISSAYVFVEGFDEKNKNESLRAFRKSYGQTLPAFQFEHLSKEQTLEKTKIQLFMYLTRNKEKGEAQLSLKDFFNSITGEFLPNAAPLSYKGKSSELQQFSIHAKQYISPDYIKQISNIFKQLYRKIGEKRYGELVLTGNIASKILKQFVKLINSKKNILLQEVIKSILRQLYISAYNFCVVGYHDELEAYFGDEKPKNSDRMYEVFSSVSSNAVDKFNQFSLNKQLHEEYLGKLLNHIDEKQILLSRINKQKTQEILINQFQKYSQKNEIKPLKVVQFLKNVKPELDDGRSEAIQKILMQLYERSSGSSLKSSKVLKLGMMQEKVQKLKQQKIKAKEEYRKRLEAAREKMDRLKKQKKGLQQNLSMIAEQKQRLNGGEVNKEQIDRVKLTILKVRQKRQQKMKELEEYKKEDHQKAVQKNEKRFIESMEGLRNRQKEVAKRIEQVQKEKKENPEQGEGEKRKSEKKVVEPDSQQKQKQKSKKMEGMKKSEKSKIKK